MEPLSPLAASVCGAERVWGGDGCRSTAVVTTSPTAGTGCSLYSALSSAGCFRSLQFAVAIMCNVSHGAVSTQHMTSDWIPGGRNLGQLEELHACLRRLLEKQLLVSISNNKADQEYLKLGAGIDSHHVPSLCMYTNVEWDKDKAQDVGACLGFRHSSEEGAGKPTALGSLLEQKVPALVPRPRAGIAKSEHHGVVRTTAGHTWQDLYQRKALVHLPYEMSTMSLFEQYSAGVPLIFPTKRFYVELIKSGIIKVILPGTREFVTRPESPNLFLTLSALLLPCECARAKASYFSLCATGQSFLERTLGQAPQASLEPASTARKRLLEPFPAHACVRRRNVS